MLLLVNSTALFVVVIIDILAVVAINHVDVDAVKVIVAVSTGYNRRWKYSTFIVIVGGSTALFIAMVGGNKIFYS